MPCYREILRPQHWDIQYRRCRPIWDTGRPTSQLCDLVRNWPVLPCRALELGCGAGANALWLARQGFNVTAIDLSPDAIQRARRSAVRAGVTVDFRTGNLCDPETLTGTYDFFFDCGCYGAVRLADREGYYKAVLRLLRPGALGLLLVGNADEPEQEDGPPVMTAEELCAEWQPAFHILGLHACRFDAMAGYPHFLAWACRVRRHTGCTNNSP